MTRAEKSKIYYQDHLEEYRIRVERRRLKKKKLLECFTQEEWQKKVDVLNGICPNCGRLFSEVYPHCVTQDHYPPISKAPIGYMFTIENMLPLCGACNTSFGNRDRVV